jgi:iron complex outermembrane recepter protein
MKWFLKWMWCVLILFVCIAFSGVAAIQAQESQKEAGPGVFNLGEVVVTGKGETITQVTTVETVDRERIDLTNSEDVAQALETLPGVFVSKGSRNEAYLNVRGFNQRYVPIFVDGIPWYVPNDGYVDASEILTGNLSQITLTKGAASVLYGPNTMGGVINIVTMKPQKQIDGSYGAELSQNGPFGGLNLGSRVGPFYVMAGASALDFDKFRMSDEFIPITSPLGFRGYFENGGTRDNSDEQSFSGSLKAGFTPAEGHEYAVGTHYVRSERGLPPNVYVAERQRFWRFTQWEKWTHYFIGDTKVTDGLSAKTRLYYDTYYNALDSYDDATYSSQVRPAAFHSTYDDFTSGGSLVLRSTYIPRNTLSFAFHYKDNVHREQGNYTALWKKYEDEIYSYGLEDDIKLSERLALVLGASYDLQKSKYADGGPLRDDDDSFNPLGGLVYSFEDATKVHFSVAKKTRFPTLNELFSSYLGAVIPNPNLNKEEAINYEAGVERPLPWYSYAGLSIYYYDIKDLIVRTTVGPLTSTRNVGKAKYQGFELSLRTEGIPLNTLEAHYAYLDASDKSDNRTSDHLRESPKHQIYASDLVKLNDWFSLFGKLQYNIGQWDQKSNLEWIELNSYWTFDLKAMVTISKMALLELGVRNAFDENYETAYGFPREGRTFFCGLRGAF